MKWVKFSWHYTVLEANKNYSILLYNKSIALYIHSYTRSNICLAFIVAQNKGEFIREAIDYICWLLPRLGVKNKRKQFIDQATFLLPNKWKQHIHTYIIWQYIIYTYLSVSKMVLYTNWTHTNRELDFRIPTKKKIQSCDVWIYWS